MYDSSTSAFLRKPELRTRLIPLDNRVIINVLPEGVAFDALAYTHDTDGNLTLSDGTGFELDISNEAKPRNEAKPTMSVTVVRKIDDDCAGSRPR